MARIRIIDEWLRSPVSGPSRHRAIMVVTDSWAEQRVLMRAFATSNDQTRPTIELHGARLAIGPASTDPHGNWGIHVEPPVDGRAQQLRSQLETAARRLAGAKGNPPRLQDEVSRFEGKRTQYWAPGTPPDLPPGRRNVVPPRRTTPPNYYEPAVVAPPLQSARIPSAAKRNAKPVGRRRKRGWTTPQPMRAVYELASAQVGSTTAMGYAGGPVIRGRRRAGAPNRSVAKLASRTMPPGLVLGDAEKRVIEALSAEPALTAERIGQIAGVPDGAAWIEDLCTRLGQHGVDLIERRDTGNGQATYALRR